jgi:Retrotransposon gag protein
MGLQQYLKPPVFRGFEGEDPDEWIEQFEVAARANEWDEVAHVSRYLEGTARQWWRVVKAPSHWEDVVQRGPDGDFIVPGWKSTFVKYFRPEDFRMKLEERLRERVQAPGEAVINYYVDVLHLCDKLDRQMPESQKVRHLRRGVTPSLIRALALEKIVNCQQFLFKARARSRAERWAREREIELAAGQLPVGGSSAWACPRRVWSRPLLERPSLVSGGPEPSSEVEPVERRGSKAYCGKRAVVASPAAREVTTAEPDGRVPECAPVTEGSNGSGMLGTVDAPRERVECLTEPTKREANRPANLTGGQVSVENESLWELRVTETDLSDPGAHCVSLARAARRLVFKNCITFKWDDRGWGGVIALGRLSLCLPPQLGVRVATVATNTCPVGHFLHCSLDPL